MHVEDAGCDRTDSGIFITERFDVVEHDGSFGCALCFEGCVDNLFKQTFVHSLGNFGVELVFFVRSVHKSEILRHSFVEDKLTDGGFDYSRLHNAVKFPVHTNVDCRLQFDFVVEVCHFSFVYVAECHAFALGTGLIHSEVERTDDHILSRRTDRLSVGKFQNIVGRQHKHSRFGLSFDGKRNVYCHLVAVEVRVERAACERMELYCSAVYKHGFKRLNTKAVQGGRTVEKHGMIFYDAFEYSPNFIVGALRHTLCVFDVMSYTVFYQFVHDKRFEQLESHFLGQTALIHFEFGSYDDNATTGIIDTFTEQVLTETALFSAEQSGQ